MNNLLLQIAKAELGVTEIPGVENNPRILHYARQSGQYWVKSEDTSWCALFVAFVISEIPEFMRPIPPNQAAKAREWLKMGVDVPLENARPSDLVIFWRSSTDSWQGHVGFYLGRKGDDFLVLGGNQGNSVCERYFSKDRLLGIRRL